MAAPIATSALPSHLENVEKLSDLHEVEKALQQLSKEEEKVNDDLNGLLQQQSALHAKMANLYSTLPNLQLIEEDSQQLSKMVSFTSTLAENVSSKVRQLDLAKGRVVQCMQRVDDILDLKFCTDGVQGALHSEDYEQAAAHVHRFLSLDENVLRMSGDASEGSTLDTSFKLLTEAQHKLKSIVHNKFDAAVHAGDVASVERFFKIFPLVAEHDSGLSKFSKYLCTQLSDTAEKNLKLALVTEANDKRANVLYADTVTLLFEAIARIIEIHQPLVETYYGPGRILTMLEYLQKECDRQARKILEKFRQHREFEMKSQQVQQSLMFPKAASAEKLDSKNLDVLLAEVTLLNTRSELYLRFLKRRASTDMEVAVQELEKRKERQNEIDNFVMNCELSRQMQELIGSYIMMEEYFMREMVLKAVSMDTWEEGSLTSSMVDDALFIVKKCVRRALSSSSVDGVCAMLNHACTVLEQDFREVLFARLRLGFPSGFDFTHAYNLVQASFQQGKLQSSDQETQKAKTAFLATMNNAEVTCEYIQTLNSDLEVEVDRLYGQVNQQAKQKLQTCLSELTSVANKFRDMLDFGFTQLQTAAVKPQLKPLMDSFLQYSHHITEEEFANYEANDPWAQNVIVGLDNLLVTFKNSLTNSNYDKMAGIITTDLTVRLEKNVYKTSYNRLGGLQFDKELRALVGYLTSATTWTIRDKFARLTQMATILNLERVSEIMDYWGPNSGPLTWRLTPAEVRQVLGLRVDFRNEDIRRLKL